jgi:actin-related protein
VALAKNDKNRLELVRGASTHSDPMYEIFRETGVFVGNDARYCCYEHPDAGLRGGLEMRNVLENGHIAHKTGYLLLLQHCLFRGLGMQDASSIQLLFALKLSYSPFDLMHLSDCLFERLGCDFVCLLSEAGLIASAYRLLYVHPGSIESTSAEAQALSLQLYASTATSALIVDIGARQSTVYPVYEGIIMKSAIETCGVGGEHCTDFMELLLSAQHSDAFSTLLPRRKKLISRLIKEQYSFIAYNFDKAVEDYGGFRFDTVKPKSKNTITTVSSSSNVLLNTGNGNGNGSEDHSNPNSRPVSMRILVKTPSQMEKKKNGDSNYNDNDSEFEEIERSAVSIPTISPINRDNASDIIRDYVFSLPNGHDITLSVDKERFHCCEVLFTPSIYHGDGSSSRERGLVQTILAAVDNIDEIVREEMCSKIVIGGRSGLVPGLLARLEHSLLAPMALLGVANFSLILAEEDVDNEQEERQGMHEGDKMLPSEGYFSPTAAWRGASARVKRVNYFPIEEQNFVTCDDYNEYGPSLIQDFVVG